MGEQAERACSHQTKSGSQCKASPLNGHDTCIAHASREVQESMGFGGSQPGAGRPRNPRAIDVLRDRIEADLDLVLDPLWEALEATQGLALNVKGGGMEIGHVPDYRTRITAAKELLAYGYGKPKQITEISGPEGDAIPVEIRVPDTDEYRAKVAALAAKVIGVDGDR